MSQDPGSVEELERRRKELRDEQRALERRIEQARRAARAAERRKEVEEKAGPTEVEAPPGELTIEVPGETAEGASAEPRRPRRPRPSSRSDQKFAFGSGIQVGKDEVASDLLALGGSIEVDGEVLGDVVAVGGSVEIRGRVTGDVVAVGGKVELGPGAEVLGDATSVGARVVQAEGATVVGKVSEVAVGSKLEFGDWSWMNQGIDWRDQGSSALHAWGKLFWSILSALLLLVLTALVLLVARDPVDRVARLAFDEPFKALLVGLAVELLFLPAMILIAVLLLVSIIGIPLLLFLPFLVLLLMAASLFGFTAMAIGVGRFFKQRFSLGFDRRFAFLLAGLIGIQGIAVVGVLLDAIGLPIFIYGLFGLVGFLVKFLAWTTGLGAVVLGRFGSRSTYIPPPPLAHSPDLAGGAALT